MKFESLSAWRRFSVEEPQSPANFIRNESEPMLEADGGQGSALFYISSPALALTAEEIVAKLQAAGYSQIRETPAGKIKSYRAVKGGTERSLIVDSTGRIMEVAR
jgi:hypothetical protein